MEIKIGQKQILLFLQILSWIIFVGLCIELGGIIFNTIYAINKPIVAQYFWNKADLSHLYQYDKGQFLMLCFLMVIVAAFKALIFYLIVKLFYDKKFNLDRPFDVAVTKIVSNIAWLCLGAGLFSFWAVKTVERFQSMTIAMPSIESLRIGGADIWLFMAVVLWVIGQVFKKGTLLQTENDLTV